MCRGGAGTDAGSVANTSDATPIARGNGLNRKVSFVAGDLFDYAARNKQMQNTHLGV